MKLIALLIPLLVFCTNAVGASRPCDSYEADLKTMLEVDQAIRERISFATFPAGKVKESALPKAFQLMLVVDKVNTIRLKSLVHSCGWPRKSIDGEQATGAAWILAQHADKESQREFLPFIMAAVKAGEASPSDLAYLIDRIAVNQGRPQLYGTQLAPAGSCVLEFQPMDDRNKVDERRKAIGMPTLEEYQKMSREYFSARGCQ